MNLSFSIAGRTFSLGSTKSRATDWLRGDDVQDNAGAQLINPYAQSAWVYIAVSRLAEKVAGIPFRISTLDEAKSRRVRALRGSADAAHRNFVRRALGEHVLDSGAVVDLFDRPHPTMSRHLFWETLVTYHALRGEFFVVPLDAADNPVDLATRAPNVQRMLTLPTEMFWHIVRGFELEAWRYTGSPLMSPLPSEILLPSEVIHGRTVNPYLYWRGMSALHVAMVAAGSDFAAAKYAQGYWLNNADTGVIVTTENLLDEPQRQAIQAALRERKRKAGTADRPLFLWGGAKVEKPQLNGMETQFLENRRMNRQEIGAIFKVPESVMGFTSDKATSLSGGGAAIEAEQLQFIESTIAPLCAHLEAALESIVKSFGPGLVGWFDIEGLPVMQAARRARLDAGSKAFAMGVTFNDLNRVYDLGFPEYPWGNQSYLPFNLQAVGSTDPLPSEAEPPGEAEPASEGEKSNPFTRMACLLSTLNLQPATPARALDTHALWLKHVTTRRKTVKQVEAKVSKVLNQFRAIALAKLDEVHLGKSLAEAEQRGLVNLIFSPTEFGTKLYGEISPALATALQAAGNELHEEIGLDDPWAMPPRKVRDYLAGRQQPVQDCGLTVRKQLNTALTAGVDAGETTAQLAQRVKGVFTSLQNFEALRIAQTEVNMAYNDARHEAMSGAGIEYKAWLSSHGPAVREPHAEAEKRYIDAPIPVDEPFIVGGEKLMYPGDDALGAGPGNTINCQCINLAAQKRGEDSATLTFNVCGLGELTFPKL